jgi:hypothetical protein
VSNGLTYGFVNAGGGGGGGGGDCCKQGTYYIKVCAEGTPVQNAQEVVSAYAQAQSLVPTKDNVITIILSPGEYAFNGAFVLNTDYINLVTLTGNRDAVFDRADITGDPFSSSPLSVAYCLSLECDEVLVSGIQGKIRNSPNFNSYAGVSDFRLPINIADGQIDYTFINCHGGDFGFGADLTEGSLPKNILGRFENCEGGLSSFAYYGNADGTFINCSAISNNSFGYFGSCGGFFSDCVSGQGGFADSGIAGGVFIRCKSDSNSFGFLSKASGTFIDCISGNDGFGGSGEASGFFFNCQAVRNSFGAGDTSGFFMNCTGTTGCFGGGIGGSCSGTFINCTGGASSFADGGTCSGIFTNCFGGGQSFSFAGDASGNFTDCIGGGFAFGSGGIASGIFVNCNGESYSFGGNGGTASGSFTDCVGDTFSFGEGGTASGVFHYCDGGADSFGGNGGTLTGNLYFCRLGPGGTFTTPTGGGSITLGIDGSNNITNL